MGGPEEIRRGQRRLLELKARCSELSKARAWCEANAKLVGEYHQTDTYFRVKQGRLKIREVEGQKTATLIYYSREDLPTPKRSRVFLLQLEHGTDLNRVLGEALGVLVVVEKSRTIYRWGSTQIHLDSVAQLGHFIEFETAVEGPEEELRAQAEYDTLRAELHVLEEGLIAGSYSDLLLERGS